MSIALSSFCSVCLVCVLYTAVWCFFSCMFVAAWEFVGIHAHGYMSVTAVDKRHKRVCLDQYHHRRFKKKWSESYE